MQTKTIQTKLSVLVGLMSAGDYKPALKLAASWGKRGLGNGPEADAITKGWAAASNPSFYKSLGQDVDTLVAAGVAAIRKRYNLA